MVQFLVHAADDKGQPKYRGRLIQMLKLIDGGMPATAAFEQAFSNNYAGFQLRFLEWAKALTPTPEAEYIERQEVLGDMLVALDTYGRAAGDIAEFRRSAARMKLEIQYSKGQIKWSSGKDTDKYFSRVDGTLLKPDELFLQDRRSAPLPDIVCRAVPNAVLRTRFYRNGRVLEHELSEAPIQLLAASPRENPLKYEKRKKIFEAVLAEYLAATRGQKPVTLRVHARHDRRRRRAELPGLDDRGHVPRRRRRWPSGLVGDRQLRGHRVA
jgi:hypothetical protein